MRVRDRHGNMIISRAGYSGFGDIAASFPGTPPPPPPPGTGAGSSIFGTIGGAVKNLLSGLTGPAQQPYPVMMPDQGIDTTTLLLGGAAVAVGAFLLLRKKKA